MKHLYRVLAILLSLAIVLLYGCGTGEDENLLEARRAIANKEYQEAKTAVQTVLSENPDNVEAKCLKEILNVRDKEDASLWSKSLNNVIEYINPLNSDIKELKALIDPTSDDLDQLELYIRQRNSAMGFAALSLEEASKDNKQLLNGLLQTSGSTVIRVLLEASKSYDDKVRNTVTSLVVDMGESAIEPLADELDSSDTAIRKQAVKLLGEIGTSKVIKPITDLVSNKNEESEVLYTAAIALEKIGGFKIVEPLRLLLKTNSSQARINAAKLLGIMRIKDAVPELLPLLADDNSYVKDSAILALTKIAEPAVPNLIEILEKEAKNILPDSEEDVKLNYLTNFYIDVDRLESARNNLRIAAMTTLANLKAPSAIPYMIDSLANSDLQSGAASALTNMGEAAVPSLIESLNNSNKNIRIQASSILAQIKDRRAIEPLISSLKNDSEKDVKANAATALGNMYARGENNRAVEALTEALYADEKTMISAISALGTIKVKNNKAIERLIEIASDRMERENIRVRAINSIESLAPEEATDAMMRIMMTDGESAVIRKAAVSALGTIKDEKAKPALLWISSILNEEVDDFQRELKSRYRTLDRLKEAVDKLNIPWNVDYPKPEYNSWREIKPIPSLVRSEVARTLGKIKGEDVVDTLIESLREDERASVRESAAWALGEIKGDKVVGPLIDVLREDERGNVRAECAIALDKIGGREIVQPLLRTLKDDKYEAARKRAAIGLREEKYDFAAEGLVEVLMKGEGKYEEGHEVESVLYEVFVALYLDGSVAVEPLINAYNSSELSEVRRYAIWALGIIADSQAYDTMVKALEDESVIVRERAAALLGNLKQRKAVETLVAVVNDENEWKSVCARAVDSLGNLRDEQPIELMLELLYSKEEEIQKSAINAFGKIKDKRAVPKLIELIKERQELATVKDTAIAALGNIGDMRAEDVLLEVLNTELGAEKIELTNRIKTLRENAVVALGQIGSEKAVPDLIEILEDKNRNVTIRQNAATALARIGDERAVPVISRLLVDETEYRVSIDVDGIKRNYFWETLVNAARTFDIRDYVVPKITERLKDDWLQYKTQAFAAMALGTTRAPEASEPLREALSHSTAMIRQYAAIGLGETENREFIETLVKIMKDSEANKDVRRGATQGLGEIAAPSTVPDLIEILQDTSVHEEIRRDAAVTLGKIGNDQAVSALINEYSKPETSKNLKLDILTGLKTAASEQAVNVLQSALDSDDADIHYSAAQALKEAQGEVAGYEFV